ncbi:flagellar basal body-associated FliL family protein [Clostridium massiliodielmoense]|uniref:flagellar basal body-associated FliL family protein n=1 Tax=Clostridium massiliodielmoense TaxID=1776385 RepID=UPI0001668703|nr:flagellar basal body-associated FliL family protein [Clostridium massiliodielmoense]EDS77862.1 flagellar basal body-associated protein FliL [Clostridium botulinum C str. Eklund]KEH96943.1 flagellar basal body protein FliL [Clostridium botulinum C/D str. BKT12695]NEZ48463.1 flagellar basal body-associated FliL family protein [Clostridium botulinum]
MAETENRSSKVGGIFKVILIVFLAVILLGGGVFGGYVVASKTNPKGMASIGSIPQDTLNLKTFGLDEFLLNLKSDDNSSKYLKTNISIGYADVKENKELEDELKNKKAIIRDTINSVLRSKKKEDFATNEQVERIKKEIKDKVNPLLQKGQIYNVYFSEIIIQ